MSTAAVAPVSNPIDFVDLKLDEIQGNILAGFNNDHQRFVFLRIDDELGARAWLKSLIPKISSTARVQKSNNLRKAVLNAHGAPSELPRANWLNVAFNHPGLRKLGVNHVNEFPEEFRDGMAKRSRHLGDVGPNAPDQWDPWLQDRSSLHILVLLAADQPEDLQKSLDDLVASTIGKGVSVIHIQAGEAPRDGSGNEHFGFKDGISQPGIKGFTLSVDTNPGPNQAHQGKPGQDLLWPGEFVLGYPTQDPDRPPSTFNGPNPTKGPVSRNGPHWTENGSYLVFRKLQQDVAGFRNSVRSNATSLGISPEVLGAKIVGRFRSGCPMELTKTNPTGVDTNDGDPSVAHPELLDANHAVNFEYGDDPQGNFLPRSGHIRKAYPRDEQLLNPDGSVNTTQIDLHESRTQTHRILRRGIPFGDILPMPATGLNSVFEDDQVSRGLLFLCYQSSIKDQFEFIQTCWVNNQNFPQPGDGVDPVMAQVKTAPMQCPIKGVTDPATIELKHFVTTNGGEYFFQPSIGALRSIVN